MTERVISSPCINICAVNGRTNLCDGCGRTLKEIATWSRMSEEERLAIMDALPARQRAAREALA
jgi:predicted Fe-S protein YdhL (DUF1289 family)